MGGGSNARRPPQAVCGHRAFHPSASPGSRRDSPRPGAPAPWPAHSGPRRSRPSPPTPGKGPGAPCCASAVHPSRWRWHSPPTRAIGSPGFAGPLGGQEPKVATTAWGESFSATRPPSWPWRRMSQFGVKHRGHQSISALALRQIKFSDLAAGGGAKEDQTAIGMGKSWRWANMKMPPAKLGRPQFCA